MITQEDKCRIVARNFFNDNPDQYEDYHEALAEFMSGNNASPEFIEFCVSPYLEPAEGHVVYISDKGHVGALRLSDGYFESRTDMTEEEGQDFVESFNAITEGEPGLNLQEALLKLGWKPVVYEKMRPEIQKEQEQ